MGIKDLKWQIFQRNQLLFLLSFGLLLSLIVTAEESTTNHTARIAEIKSNLLKMIQKETFQLSGFDEFATIPITYPLDICLMEVNNNLYAVCLALDMSQTDTKTHLKVLRKVQGNPNNPLFDYVEVFSYETRSAKHMDCISMNLEGYIAVINDLNTTHANNTTEGSPIFQLKDDRVVPVQYFTRPYQRRVHFFKYHSELLMWQTFQNDGQTSNETSYCPLMKWYESKFNEIDQIPCTNAMQIESFIIDHRIYVAVANYMDEHRNIETHSAIYQYDMNEHKFTLIQRVKTFGAIDVKHIHIEDNHYLIIANSFRAYGSVHNSAITSNAIVYLYEHEHSKFVPVQILPFDAEVTHLLPYLGENKEFALIVSMDVGITSMYEFDGFQFFKTPVTFTGGSLGRGVSKMRTFKMNNDFLVLVVANSEMYRDATNLYRFKFTKVLDYDFSKAFDLFDQWYAGVQEKLQNDHIEEIFQEIQNLKPPPGFGVINFEESTIDTIHTETISSTSIPIDFSKLKLSIQKAEEILSKENVRRPKRLNDSMLQNYMNSSRPDDFDPLPDFIEMGNTLIDELIVTDSFYTEKINGRNVNDLLRTDIDLSLDTLTVGNLIIVNNTKDFDEIKRKLMENDERVKRDTTPIDNSDVPLVFNDITVQGTVNGLDFDRYVEDVLRTDVAHQVLEGPVQIRRLQADSIQTMDGKISELELTNIAYSRVEKLVIRPSMHFEKGIQVNRFKVLQHFNEIAIKKGKMDILFKRSKRVQEIQGDKEFQAINLLEPIILQGKINISSPLSKIKPIVTIDEDIQLDGDFEFIGNVTVQNVLQVQNIFGKSARYNALQVLQDGLRLDEMEIDMPLEFLQPIQIDNVEPGTRINNIPIESLILRNVSEWQWIYGAKTFTSDLSVDGNCEVLEINGVNIQQLNNTILKKSGENQIVTGTIQFDRITANKIHVDRLFIGKTPIDRLLTLDTDQIINANITIHGNILLANDSDIEIQHLSMNGRIFGVDVPKLLDDSYVCSPNKSITITTDKRFENVTIDRLIIEDGCNFWQTGQTTADIAQLLNGLNSDFRITGPISFDAPFFIDGLTVTDAINDIPCLQFGKDWLLFNGSQIFTVPQNFTDVTFNDNIQLYGRLNGLDLPQLVADTISIDEPAMLQYVIFDNVHFKKSLTIGGTLAGIRIPDDLILGNSDSLQNFNGPLTFASNVNIIGTLSIADKLNGFNLGKMCELFEPQSDVSPQKLTITGDVIFNNSPTIEYLNAEPFEYMRLTTWMVNDRYVNFTADIQFNNVILHKSITTTGLVNNVDLQSLNERYLSLSRPQKVTTPLRFRGRVEFRDTLIVDTLSLDGLIKIPASDITLNITDFDQNVLKTTNSTQFIRGSWQFNEIQFLGSLTSTTINGLNFAADIVRWSSPSTNLISAPKRFQSLNIDRLECLVGCSMQGVDMADWTSKAVFTTSNHTIQGTVYARNAVISFVEALGLVNNMTFNSQNILLKSVPQKLNGALTIGDENFSLSSITALTFDNLMVNSINDQNVSEFFTNIIQRGENGTVVDELYANLEFSNRLDIDDLTVTGQFNGINVNQFMATDQPNENQYRMAADELDTFVNKLSSRERFKHFDQMIVRKIYENGIHRLQKLVGYDFEFVAINNSSKIGFYRWDSTQKTLEDSNIPLALPEDMVVIDLTVLRADLMHLLVIQMQNSTGGQFVQQFYDYTHDLQHTKLVYEMTDNDETIIQPFIFDQHHCFILYRKVNATRFSVHCMDHTDIESEKMSVHQIDVQNETNGMFYEITDGGMNTLILWFMNGIIESQSYETQDHFGYSIRKQFNNVTSVAVGKKTLGEKSFMAISMHMDMDVLDGSSATSAIISIYRVEDGRDAAATPKHYWDIQIPNAVVLQCEFSKLSNVQTILVVAIQSGPKEMIRLYQDKGVNGFQLLQKHKISWDTSMPLNFHTQFRSHEKRFSLIESENGILSFIAAYSGREMILIECVYA